MIVNAVLVISVALETVTIYRITGSAVLSGAVVIVGFVMSLTLYGAFLQAPCESELVAVEGRKLTFKVSLHDEKGPVGGGIHERFVVNDAKFAAKAEAKKG